MSQISIDRFEQQFAVCQRQDGTVCRILRKELPLHAKPGDLFTCAPNGTYTPEPAATRQRRTELSALQKQLFSQRKK